MEAQISLTLLHIISMIYVIGNNTDVLIISETKLDASFPSSQFILDGFTPPYRLDRTQHGGGVMLFIREDIPYKFFNAIPLSVELKTY